MTNSLALEFGFLIIGIIALFLFILILKDLIKDIKIKKDKNKIDKAIRHCRKIIFNDSNTARIFWIKTKIKWCEEQEKKKINKTILEATNDFKQLDLEEQSERFKNG